MENLQRQLVNRLEQKGLQILEINLYDLSLEIIKSREDNLFDLIVEHEPTMEKQVLMEQLQNVLDAETYLTPAISEKMKAKPFNIMFISGVGEVFPYIRSHNMLNNLQSTAKEKPTLMFFPGEYSHTAENGSSLNLFGKFSDDKYYRAFNIYHTHA